MQVLMLLKSFYVYVERVAKLWKCKLICAFLVDVFISNHHQKIVIYSVSTFFLHILNWRNSIPKCEFDKISCAKKKKKKKRNSRNELFSHLGARPLGSYEDNQMMCQL